MVITDRQVPSNNPLQYWQQKPIAMNTHSNGQEPTAMQTSQHSGASPIYPIQRRCAPIVPGLRNRCSGTLKRVYVYITTCTATRLQAITSVSLAHSKTLSSYSSLVVWTCKVGKAWYRTSRGQKVSVERIGLCVGVLGLGTARRVRC